MAEDPESILQAVNDRAVTRLLVEAGSSAVTGLLQRDTRTSASAVSSPITRAGGSRRPTSPWPATTSPNATLRRCSIRSRTPTRCDGPIPWSPIASCIAVLKCLPVSAHGYAPPVGPCCATGGGELPDG